MVSEKEFDTYNEFESALKAINCGCSPTGMFFIHSLVFPLITDTVFDNCFATYIRFVQALKAISSGESSGPSPTGISFIHSFVVPLITDIVLER